MAFDQFHLFHFRNIVAMTIESRGYPKSFHTVRAKVARLKTYKRLASLILFFYMVTSPSIGSTGFLWETVSDPRSRALGNTGAALPNLGFALDANPALLTQTKRGSVGLSNGNLYNDPFARVDLVSAHGTIGTEMLLDRVAVGMTYKRFKSSIGRGPTYSDPYGLSSTINDYFDNIYQFGTAARIGRSISVGMALVHTTHTNGNGIETSPEDWDVDLGLYVEGLIPSATFGDEEKAQVAGNDFRQLATPKTRGFSLGISVKDFGTRASKTSGVKVAAKLELVTLGLSYRPILTHPLSVLLVSEVQMRDPINTSPFEPVFNSEYLRWGVETELYELVALRFGMETESASGRYHLTYGFGVGPGTIRFESSFYWSPDSNSTLFYAQPQDSKFGRWGLSIEF